MRLGFAFTRPKLVRLLGQVSGAGDGPSAQVNAITSAEVSEVYKDG